MKLNSGNLNMQTIDEALNYLRDRARLDRWTPYTYIIARDALILDWPNKVELLTHPEKAKRELFAEVLKHFPERVKQYTLERASTLAEKIYRDR